MMVLIYAHLCNDADDDDDIYANVSQNMNVRHFIITAYKKSVAAP